MVSLDGIDLSQIDFEPHSDKQAAAILSEHKITLTLTGVQWGKTSVGAIWMKRHMFEYLHPDDSFIITAPNYKIMKQATLPAFLSRMEGLGEFAAVDMVFRMQGGGTCYFRTATQPDSIVGITNVRAIWGDEAGKYGLYFWENIQARASFKACPILLTTTPYATNWIYKELVKPTKDRKRSDLLLIEASSDENPHFSKKEFEDKRQTMDPRRFAALYLGVFSRMQGLVYPFEESEHVIYPFHLPSDTKYVGGVDWGYTDPFVCNIRAITPNGYHFTVSETYQSGLLLRDQVRIAKEKTALFGVEMFYADPSQPGSIEEFNRQGIPTVGANNDIRRGIDTHYELIRSGKYKVFQGMAPHLVDEYASYHYPEPSEVKPDQDSKEQRPVGHDDHGMDVERYITIMTIRSMEKNVPRVPNENPNLKKMDHAKRIEQLKKIRGKHRGSESWN